MTRPLLHRENATEQVAQYRALLADRYSLDREKRRGAGRRLKEAGLKIRDVDPVLSGCLANEAFLMKSVQHHVTGGTAAGSLDEALLGLLRRREETAAHLAALPLAEPVPA